MPDKPKVPAKKPAQEKSALQVEAGRLTNQASRLIAERQQKLNDRHNEARTSRPPR